MTYGLDTTFLVQLGVAEHSLGRRRILDTLLAATYRCAGITAIISSNARDYHLFFKTVLTP